MGAAITTAAVRLAHVEALAADMRPADALECLALGYASPRAALVESLEMSSLSGTLLLGDTPAAIFGLAPLPRRTLIGPGAGMAVAWALTGRCVDAHPIAFHRAARAVLAEMHRHSPVLLNYVDARYGKAIRWLKRLGFKVAAAAPFGASGEPFHLIVSGRA